MGQLHGVPSQCVPMWVERQEVPLLLTPGYWVPAGAVQRKSHGYYVSKVHYTLGSLERKHPWAK